MFLLDNEISSNNMDLANNRTTGSITQNTTQDRQGVSASEFLLIILRYWKISMMNMMIFSH